MNIKTELLRMALIKAFAESLTAFVDGERKSVLDTLLEKYEDEGSKSFNVTLPDKTKIATITLPEPKATDKVVDEAALFEWAEAQGGIDVQVIPAVAERTVKTIRPKWYDGIIKKAMEGDDGDLVDETSGEVIPGVKRIPGGDPKSFTVRFEPDGRETDLRKISRAVFEQRLEKLLSDGEPWTVYFNFRMIGRDTGVLVRFDGRGKVASSRE